MVKMRAAQTFQCKYNFILQETEFNFIAGIKT